MLRRIHVAIVNGKGKVCWNNLTKLTTPIIKTPVFNEMQQQHRFRSGICAIFT